MSNEAETCREYVVPRLLDAGWDRSPHRIAEQKSFTDGRIVVSARPHRRRGKRADYLQDQAEAKKDDLLSSVLDSAFQGEL